MSQKSPVKAVYLTYRSALALNNMGIALLERHRYKPAFKTLTESLSLLKAAFRVGKPDEDSNDDDNDKNLNSCTTLSLGRSNSTRKRSQHDKTRATFERASQRFRRNMKMIQTTTTSESSSPLFFETCGDGCNSSHDGLHGIEDSSCSSSSLSPGVVARSDVSPVPPDIEIHAMDDFDFLALRHAVLYGPSYSVFFGLLITEAPGPKDGGADRTDIACQLGMILYNHGLAQLLLAMATTATTNRKKQRFLLLNGASTSLAMAECTFASLLCQKTSTSKNEPQQLHQDAMMMMDDITLLWALLMNCQSLVFGEQNLPRKALRAQRLVASLVNNNHLPTDDGNRDNCYSHATQLMLLCPPSAPAA